MTTISFCTYNIQYSRGRDEVFDLDRVAAAIQDADVVALQEVDRNRPDCPDADQPGRLGELFPHHFWVYAPARDYDRSTTNPDGTVENLRWENGQMVLSRYPIRSSRSISLPSQLSPWHRTALETVIALPGGDTHVFSVHLDSRHPRARKAQIDALMSYVSALPAERTHGRSTTGSGLADRVVVLGDMNHRPTDDEYRQWVSENDWYYGTTIDNDRLVDTWTAVGDGTDGLTWRDDRNNYELAARIDYGFVTPRLADQLGRAWVDQDADGSDHQPVWFTITDETAAPPADR